MSHTLDDLYDDERAGAIFMDVFNPADDMFEPDRDGDRFKECVARIVALGYSEEDATEFMEFNLLPDKEKEDA